MTKPISRRAFVKDTGVLIIGFSFGRRHILGAAAERFATLAPSATQLDSWLVVAADGSVTVYCGKVELGTGVSTALRQIVAE